MKHMAQRPKKLDTIEFNIFKHSNDKLLANKLLRETDNRPTSQAIKNLAFQKVDN